MDRRFTRGHAHLALWCAAAAVLVGLLALAPGAQAAGGQPGVLYAFGSNASGELGVPTDSGTQNANPTPAPVSLPGATGPVVRATAGGGHSFAVTSTGQLYAFGDNQYGELGNTTNNGTSNANPTPTLVALPGATGPVIDASAGAGFSLALTSTGQLYAFGDNQYGQLGNATNNGTTNANPTPTLVSLPGATGPVSEIAAGGYHSLAVTSTGQLYAFGANLYGELGNPTNSGTLTPNPTPTQVLLLGAIGPVTAVAAGFYDSFAVTSSGQLYAFGDNQFGQLGNATNNGTLNPNPTPTKVSLPGASGSVSRVSSGSVGFTLALTSSGQLFAFGSNGQGELGNATNNGTTNANPTPALVTLPGETGPVTQINAGGAHSLAVTSSGQLYAFGANYFGQLANATNTATFNANPTPTLVTLPGGDTVDTVARGFGDHTLALTSDLAIATASLPAATTGTAYSAPMTASGGTAPDTWSASGLPAGLAIDASSGTISGTPSAAGTSTATILVTDTYGSVASRQLPITVSPPPGPPGASMPPGSAAPVTPVLSALQVTPGTVALSGRRVKGRCVAQSKANRTRPSCKRAASASISYTLSTPATVTITVQGTAAGRRVKGRCVAQTKANRKRPGCKRTIRVPGALTQASRAGRTVISWNLRLGGRTLAPGTYTISASPTSNGRAGAMASTRLTLTR